VQKLRSTFGFRFTYASIFVIVMVTGIAIYGLTVTTSYIVVNSTTPFFEAYAYLIGYLPDYNVDNNNSNKAAIIGPDWFRDYYWIPRYVFNIDVKFLGIGRPPSDYTQAVIIADKSVMDILDSSKPRFIYYQRFFEASKPIGTYNDQLVKPLPRPDIALIESHHREIVGDYGGRIEIRANY
jgi:hypothetical protein